MVFQGKHHSCQEYEMLSVSKSPCWVFFVLRWYTNLNWQVFIFANNIRSFPRACLFKTGSQTRICIGIQMHVCTRTHTHTLSSNTHTPVQISPPAVHFSLALWSLFMSPHVPPFKPLFPLHSPSVSFHEFLPPFLISPCVSDSPSLSTLCVQSRLSNVSSCHCESSEM